MGPFTPGKAGYPLQLVAVDLLGPLSCTNRKWELLRASGSRLYFTRWMEAYPVLNQEALTVAKELTQEHFFWFSMPEQLHSDQGRQLESAYFRESDMQFANIK